MSFPLIRGNSELKLHWMKGVNIFEMKVIYLCVTSMRQSQFPVYRAVIY